MVCAAASCGGISLQIANPDFDVSFCSPWGSYLLILGEQSSQALDIPGADLGKVREEGV